MDVKKIQILLDTLKAGSFLKAAESLGYTPSGLTHMMDSLERDLGITVLNRGRFGISLTPEGNKLLPLFKELAEAEQKIRNEVRKMNSQKQEVIRIGAYASIARNWLPALINGFYEINPAASIETTVSGIEELYEAMKKREVDIIFVCSWAKYVHEYMPLAKDHYRAVLPLHYESASEEIFDLKEFEQAPFIMPSFGKDIDVQKVLDENGISIKKLAASADDPVVLSMVSGGLGISMLSDLVLKGSHEKVKVLPIRQKASRVLGIAVRSLQNLTPLEKEFIQFTKKAGLGEARRETGK